MDRFMGHTEEEKQSWYIYLKSNMDRFMAKIDIKYYELNN